MNPTKEEIAGWLREETDMYVRLSKITDGAIKDMLLAKVQLIEDRAAQVEQSTTGRCESCRWYELDFCTNSENLVGNPRGDRAHVIYCGPQFGCIHWEQKP